VWNYTSDFRKPTMAAASVLRVGDYMLLDQQLGGLTRGDNGSSGYLGHHGSTCATSALRRSTCSLPRSSSPNNNSTSTSGRLVVGRGGISCSAASSHREAGSFDWKNPLAFLFPDWGAPPPSTTSRLTGAARDGTASDFLGWAPWVQGEFELVSVLGHGSYGVVHLALDRAGGRDVAVKLQAKTRKRLEQRKVLEKLRREVSVLTDLQACPQTVRLYATREDEEDTYLVMENLRGGTLAEMVDKAPDGRVAEADIIHSCRGILNFLAACHERGILYGDVKPANFIRDTGLLGVRAIDFGCSQRQSPNDVYFNSRCGTPAYFAPEVFRKCFTLEADLWSLGMMMYVFVTGRFPWWEDMSVVGPKEVEDRVMYQEVPFVEKEWAHVSPAMLDLVQRLLEKNPAQRISAAQALAHPVMNGKRVVSGPLPPPRADRIDVGTFRAINSSDEDPDCMCAGTT